MKKIIYTLLLLLSASIPSMSANYFTMGVNDSIRINPYYYLNTALYYPAKAHFDDHVDSWSVTIAPPPNLSLFQVSRGSDMDITFTNRSGQDSVCHANLSIQDTTNFSTKINELGYWDYDNDFLYETYGTVKWEAGDYSEMIILWIRCNQYFTGGVINLYGMVSSTYDWRGGNTLIGGVMVSHQVVVTVGFMTGDVSGDEHIDITDVTLLQNYVLTGDGLDAYQIAAADIDGDGIINITDVSLLLLVVLNGA